MLRGVYPERSEWAQHDRVSNASQEDQARVVFASASSIRSISRMAKIAFQAITKQFPGSTKPAVDAVTFEVPEGITCMLVGTSGSGKTTLLRMVNRLIEPTSGEIIIDGKNILEENPIQLRRRIGYVIQQVGLFPHMNIAENIRVTAEIAGTTAACRTGTSIGDRPGNPADG